MDERILIGILAFCGLVTALIVLGILVGYITMSRIRGYFMFGMVQNMLGYGGKEEDAERNATKILAAPPHERQDPQQVIESLDFDSAVAKYRSLSNNMAEDDSLTPAAEVDPVDELKAQDFDVNISSPITGRVMRDGRVPRVTADPPINAGDFRRVSDPNDVFKPKAPHDLADAAGVDDEEK